MVYIIFLILIILIYWMPDAPDALAIRKWIKNFIFSRKLKKVERRLEQYKKITIDDVFDRAVDGKCEVTLQEFRYLQREDIIDDVYTDTGGTRQAYVAGISLTHNGRPFISYC